jgi:hypothetical protein
VLSAPFKDDDSPTGFLYAQPAAHLSNSCQQTQHAAMAFTGSTWSTCCCCRCCCWCCRCNPCAAVEAVHVLTVLAQGLVQGLPWEDSSWVAIACVVARAWCAFNEACFLFHSRKSAPAALLLTRPLLQLVEAIAQQTEDPTATHGPAIQLLGPPVATFDVALNASDHPGLRSWLPSSSISLSAQQAEVCGANVRAALQQQVRRARQLWDMHACASC